MPNQLSEAERDEYAAALGPTPYFDEFGNVVPIGKPEGKVRYYVVWVGRAIGIYMNWGIVSTLTCEYSGATFKKYTTLKDARLGWEQGPVSWNGKWEPPREPREACKSCKSVAAPPVDVPTMPAYVPSRDQSPVRDPSSYKFHTSPQRIPISLPREEAEPPSSDEELYWAEDDPFVPPSPSLSSASFISGSLTPGTLSPGSVRTPLIPTPSLAAMSISSPRTSGDAAGLQQPGTSSAQRPLGLRRESITRSISCGPSQRREPSPVKRSTRPTAGTPSRTAVTAAASPAAGVPSRGAATAAASPTASAPSLAAGAPSRPAGAPSRPAGAPSRPAGAPSRAAATTAASPVAGASSSRADKKLFEPDVVKVRAAKEVYVVVRGDYPGVYLDRNTAMVKLGTSPGMKLTRFTSRSVAGWYFTQQYMAGQVGVPVVVVEDE
ncbi:hypothetical protein TRAPUB_10980 [Trametes pubescens]|uniref:Ribonuclease H1 N-terminal domain-containing protein n=1 Tax=Trametes pubescens TaxID=154538 RepID=A0A1M2VY72_TRAPU|nr:hypothetical protein TRAPUB_10980 [Trametes pubescens]